MKITRNNLTLHNIKRFFIAYYRIYIFKLGREGKFKWLFDKFLGEDFYNNVKYVQEQQLYRLDLMAINPNGKQCLANGGCIKCGCAVPGLQAADDSCEGGCYPPLLNSKDWEDFKKTDKYVNFYKTKY